MHPNLLFRQERRQRLSSYHCGSQPLFEKTASRWSIPTTGGRFSKAAWEDGSVELRVLLHTVHGPYTDYVPSLRSRLKIALRHFLERRLAQRFYRIVAVSDAIRDYIEKSIGIPPARLLTVHNGIPAIEDVKPVRSDRSTITFMTVGRLAPVKRLV